MRLFLKIMVYGRDEGWEFVPRAVLPGGVGLSMRDVGGSIEGGEVAVYIKRKGIKKC